MSNNQELFTKFIKLKKNMKNKILYQLTNNLINYTDLMIDKNVYRNKSCIIDILNKKDSKDYEFYVEFNVIRLSDNKPLKILVHNDEIYDNPYRLGHDGVLTNYVRIFNDIFNKFKCMNFDDYE